MKGKIKMSRTIENQKLAMKTPPIVSQQEWEAARQQLLVKRESLHPVA